MDEKNYWLGFSAFPGVGPIKFKHLLSEFKTAKKAWNTDVQKIEKILGQVLAKKFEDFKNKFSIEIYAKELKKRKISFLTLADNNYPELLKKSGRPPFVLYVKGSKEILNSSPTIAVVGTRRITSYGEEVTRILVSDLVGSGFTIVSGLALGVDAVASAAAIGSGGKTIAVLGCGVDCVTPLENSRLYDEIIRSGGAIVSEFPLGHPPLRGSFPSRNRIIAGLSLGVLVTEGAEDSGSLITADYAFKFKRSVFAVPGSITSTLSKGPYALIQKGAKLVTSAQDILAEFKMQNSKVKITTQNLKVKTENKDEDMILKLLENESLNFDEIVRRSKIDPSKIATLLSMMEIKGLIKNSGGLFSIAS